VFQDSYAYLEGYFRPSFHTTAEQMAAHILWLFPCLLALYAPTNTGLSTEPHWALTWETDTILNTVESVYYDAQSGYLYTANIEGHFLDKDGQGSISKVSVTGEIVERNWVSGLDAPTGLWVHEGKLYTTDIDRVHIIDITEGTLVKTIPIPEAKALNDVTVSPEGIVYTSDTGGNALFAIDGETVTQLPLEVNSPNGLVAHQGGLLMSQWTPQDLCFIDLEAGTIIILGTGIPQADGVFALEQGAYWVSSWGGEVHTVGDNQSVCLALSDMGEGVGAADVTYIPELKLAVVATFNQHSLRAYQVSIP